MRNHIWGIDLGGTKIEACVLDVDANYEVLVRKRIATEQEGGYQHILTRIALLVDQVSDEIGYRPTTFGIGTPGALGQRSGLLKNSNTTCLNHKPFKTDLESLVKMPILMANDANCFALAEYRLGSVRSRMPEASVAFGVIMGTGVGGGLVVDGRVLNGLHGIAGEWGHNFLDDSGGPCYCGKSGCVERVLSGKALERYYTGLTNQTKKLKDIYLESKNGDKHAVQTIDRLVSMFGYAISWIVNIIDPEVIVLGGGVGNIPDLYTRGVEHASRYIFNTEFDTMIIPPELGDSAGVFGAALLVE